MQEDKESMLMDKSFSPDRMQVSSEEVSQDRMKSAKFMFDSSYSNEIKSPVPD